MSNALYDGCSVGDAVGCLRSHQVAAGVARPEHQTALERRRRVRIDREEGNVAQEARENRHR